MVKAEKNVGFYTHRPLEMHLPKPGKYSEINKSTIFGSFCHLYLNPRIFISFYFDPKNENLEQI